MLIGEDPVESAASQPIFMCVLRLEDFGHAVLPGEESVEGGGLLILTVPRPLCLLVAVPIVFVIREVPIPREQSEGLILRRSLPLLELAGI